MTHSTLIQKRKPPRLGASVDLDDFLVYLMDRSVVDVLHLKNIESSRGNHTDEQLML